MEFGPVVTSNPVALRPPADRPQGVLCMISKPTFGPDEVIVDFVLMIHETWANDFIYPLLDSCSKGIMLRITTCRGKLGPG